MQRRGGKKKFDNHDVERQDAGTFADKFPALELMVIRIIYYQKGDNPVLMTRTLHVYPEDYAYFHIPCLIHDCVEGNFDLVPVIMNVLKESKTKAEGRLACKGSLSKDLPPDHGYIEYTIDVTYKAGSVKPEAAEKKKDKVVTKAPAKVEEVKPSSVKKGPTKPVKKELKSKGKTSAKTTAKKPAKTTSKTTHKKNTQKATQKSTKKVTKKSAKKTSVTGISKKSGVEVKVKSKVAAPAGKAKAKTSGKKEKARKPQAKKTVAKTKTQQKTKASTGLKKKASNLAKKKR